MIYEEYHSLLKRYKEAENNYYLALDKKSRLLSGVFPGSSKIKEVMVDSSCNSYDDALINYTSELEEVDKLINEARNTKDVLLYELKLKEDKLKSSIDIYDRIYVYKWIEHRRVKQYYRLLNYSKRQIYRFIDEMKEKIYSKESWHKMAQNGTKKGV